jgi:hypothetical protein
MVSTALRRASAIVLLLVAAVPTWADEIPAEFRGDWVPEKAACSSAQRLGVGDKTLTLVNGKDVASYGDVGVPTSYFGPDYTGNSIVAIPEVNSMNAPFTVYFNHNEKKGVAMVEIYVEMKGPQNAQVKAIQDAAKKLAGRFPDLNLAALKKCR